MKSRKNQWPVIIIIAAFIVIGIVFLAAHHNKKNALPVEENNALAGKYIKKALKLTNSGKYTEALDVLEGALESENLDHKNMDSKIRYE